MSKFKCVNRRLYPQTHTASKWSGIVPVLGRAHHPRKSATPRFTSDLRKEDKSSLFTCAEHPRLLLISASRVDSYGVSHAWKWISMQDPERLRQVSTSESTSRHCGTQYRACAKMPGSSAVHWLCSRNEPPAGAFKPKKQARSVFSGTKPRICLEFRQWQPHIPFFAHFPPRPWPQSARQFGTNISVQTCKERFSARGHSYD